MPDIVCFLINHITEIKITKRFDIERKQIPASFFIIRNRNIPACLRPDANLFTAYTQNNLIVYEAIQAGISCLF